MAAAATRSFAAASAVRPVGPGRYEADIAPGWDIIGATNGGYLLAIAARALAGETGRDPVTVTGHYLAPVAAGPVEIATEVVKQGRALSTGSATMRAQGQPVLAALGSFGEIESDRAELLRDADPVRLPLDPESSPRVVPDPSVGMPPAFFSNVDVRLHPEDTGFWKGTPSGSAEMRGWFRLEQEEPWDAPALIMAADAFPPTIFNAGLPVGWTPTVELTVHVRAVPPPGWLKMEFRTRFVGQGRLESDGLIWDAEDRLLAQSRQLALVPRSS